MAVPPVPSPGDPSMDDILASIRRMVNEDDRPKPEEGVLQLEESMLVPEAPSPALPAPAPAVAPVPEPVMAAAHGPLVGPDTEAAAASSVGALMRTLATERGTAVHRGGPTLEDLVREELRPLVKQWLDQHLPPLVERLVRAEIERVVSRMAP